MKKTFKLLAAGLALGLSLSFVPAQMLTLRAEESSQNEQSEQEEMQSYTDDAGRTVSLPKKIERIAPSGGLASLILYTAGRDKLVALSKSFSDKQKKFIPEKYHNLPEVGQFYGKGSNLNMEALIAAKPQVIIDLGQAKKTIKEDMDKIMEQTGIPTVFLKAEMGNMAECYQKLGALLGEEEHCQALSEFCQSALDKAKTVREGLTDDQKKTVYWAMGDEGLNTNARESFQSEVLQLVGAQNVVDAEAQSRGGATQVSMEDLLKWKPEYILIDNKGLAETIEGSEAFQDLIKQSSAQTVLVPRGPYGFLSAPPSVNRFIGIYWLGQLLYPEQYTEDLHETVKKFYSLFYGYELNDQELASLLGENAKAEKKAA